MWTAEAALDIDAPPERVWALLADVPGWPHWNAGVASATLHGPLASGSHFDMQLPDGGPLLRSTLHWSSASSGWERWPPPPAAP